MTTRSILIALGAMLLVSLFGAMALTLYACAEDGEYALELLERSNPAWEGIGRYERPIPAHPARE